MYLLEVKRNKVVSSLKPTSIRFPPSLKKRLDQALVDRDIFQQDAIIQAVEQWLSGPAVALAVEKPPAEAAQRPLFRKENARWHEILEQVLNDPDEALGIMKNLEWAERTVLEKRRRPAGRLANGE